MFKVTHFLEIPAVFFKSFKCKIKVNGANCLNIICTDSDRIYRKKFRECLLPELYKNHAAADFHSCAFCINLKKAHCHKHCFNCSKEMYQDCGRLLPGIIPAKNHNLNNTPWLFRPACINFQRLEIHSYIKHMVNGSPQVATNNLEILEGLFFGISNGSKPCHICASVHMKIFDECSSRNRQFKQTETPCTKAFESIKNAYGSNASE